MKTNPRVVLPIASLVLLLALAWVWSRGRQDPTPMPPRHRNVVSEEIHAFERRLVPEPTSSPTILRYRFHAGDVLECRFDVETRVTLDMARMGASLGSQPGAQTAGSVGQRQTLTYGVAGSLTVAVREATSDGLLLGWRLGDALVRMEAVGTSADPAIAAGLSREVAEEVLVATSMRGRVSDLWFPKSMGPVARNLVKTVVLSMSLVLPETEEGQWEAEEEDATGRYVARYSIARNERAEDRVYARVTREKVRYTGLHVTGLGAGPRKGRHASVSTRGRTVGLFDVADGSWKSLDVDEMLTVGDPELAQDIEAATRGTFLVVAKRHDSSLAGGTTRKEGMDRSGPGGAEGVVAIADAAREERLRSRIQGATVDGLLAELSSLLEQQRDPYDAWERLAALLQLDDRAVETVLSRMRGRGLPLPVRQAVAGALGSAGTAAAQGALVGVLGSRDTEPELEDAAMVALSTVASPRPESEAFLRSGAAGATEDLRTRRSMVGLGIQASTLSNTHPERAASIVAFLRESEGRAQTSEWRRTVLDALGNTGAVETVDVALRHVSDGDEELRASAVSALRFVADPRVEDQLDRTLSSDPSPRVRAAVVDALSYRTGSKVDELLKRCAADADPQVRALAQEVLAR